MLRKNTAGQFVHIAGVNVSTGAVVTGATWTMRRCLDGTFAAGGATITEDTGTGFYKVALAQADTNGNDIGYFFTATNCVPVTLNVVTTACDPTSTAFGLSLAKTTNITGFNDLTAAQIATGVWQDSTAGDFTAASSIGKSLYTSGNAPGAASGLSLVGSNMGTVTSVTGAVGSVTGNVGGNVSGSVGSVVGAVGSVTGNVGGNVSGSVGSVVAAVAITSNIKQNQALSGFTFLMTDSTSHAPMTGATVAVTRSIDGGAFGAGALSAVSEVGNGVYSVNFGAADLNGKTIILRATATGADDTFERIVTQV